VKHARDHARSLKEKEKRRLAIGLLTIDKDRREVKLGSRMIRLTPIEFALLWGLALEPDRVFRREELLVNVWGHDISVEYRTVDAHMSKVRRKLCERPDGPSLIETIWGIGYRLRIPDP
jgi:DNA-binding response OmpR family regulator